MGDIDDRVVTPLCDTTDLAVKAKGQILIIVF